MGPLKKVHPEAVEKHFFKKRLGYSFLLLSLFEKEFFPPFDRTYSARLMGEKVNMKRSSGLLAFSLWQVQNLSAKTEMFHRA